MSKSLCQVFDSTSHQCKAVWYLIYVLHKSSRKQISGLGVPEVARSFKGFHVVEESDYRFRMRFQTDSGRRKNNWWHKGETYIFKKWRSKSLVVSFRCLLPDTGLQCQCFHPILKCFLNASDKSLKHVLHLSVSLVKMFYSYASSRKLSL